MTGSLYGDLKAAGVPLDHHESDLYCQDTPAARAIFANHPVAASRSKRFICMNDGKDWLEVPFAWLPYWEAVAERERKSHAD